MPEPTDKGKSHTKTADFVIFCPYCKGRISTPVTVDCDCSSPGIIMAVDKAPLSADELRLVRKFRAKPKKKAK
jgi:hypothetical protein